MPIRQFPALGCGAQGVGVLSGPAVIPNIAADPVARAVPTLMRSNERLSLVSTP
jgi:hypothetical protein